MDDEASTPSPKPPPRANRTTTKERETATYLGGFEIVYKNNPRLLTKYLSNIY